MNKVLQPYEKSSNTMIRWGILGTGKIASEFAEGLAQLKDARLVAVGSRQLETAQRFAQQYAVPHAYGTYTELVEDPEIDVVYIATPHVTHKTYCLLCLTAGKAVLCEKPFTLNWAEAQEVVTLARQKGLFCMEAMWMRFIPLMRRVQQLIADGAIGEVRMVHASLGFQVPFDPGHRAYNLALGGGALLDLGVYGLSLAFQLLGAPQVITSHATIGITGVDEQAAVILGYPHGQIATITTSLNTYCANDAIIMGTTGSIHIHPPIYRPDKLTLHKFQPVGAGSPVANRLKQVDLARKVYRRLRPYLERFVHGQQGLVTEPYVGNGYQYEAAEVMACLRNGKTESAIMGLDESLKIMETLDAIRRQWQLRYPQESF